MSKSALERLGPLVERVRAQSASFVARDPDVRADTGDAVHEMRVAVRRLRSCLKTFRRAFEAGATDHLVGELAWFGDLLGAARDAQIINIRIAEQLGETADDAGAEERAELLDAMDSSRYRSLVGAVATFAITPPFVPDPRGNRWLVRRLKREIARTEDFVERAEALSGDARVEALHDVRKAAKRVRYAAETLEPLYGKKARRIVKTFEALQEVLGEHHDAIVIADVLAARGAVAGGVPTAVLVERERERASAAERAFTVEWANVREVLDRHWPTA